MTNGKEIPGLSVYRAAVLAYIAAILGALLYFPVSWGMMDDGQNLAYVLTEWRTLGLWEVLRHHSTINYFRPVYTGFVYVAYRLFLHHPGEFYVCNFLFILGALLPWGWLLKRHTNAENRSWIFTLFCFCLISATPLYNLVVYLSLQEKFVIFFGGWSLLLFDMTLEDPRSSAWGWLQGAAFFSFLLAMWAKPTAIAYAPWMILALVLSRGIPWTRRVPTCLGWTVATAVLAHIYLRRQDNYSSRYTFDIQGLLHHLLGMPKLSAIGLLVAVVMVGGTCLRQRSLRLSRPLMWPVCLIGYLAALMPWGIATYLWTPAMVLMCGCLALMIDRVLTWRSDWRIPWAPWLLGGSCLMAGLVVDHIAIARIKRQAEIGQTVAWLRDRLPQQPRDVFVMEPCEETTWNLQYQSGTRESFHYLHQGQKALLTRPQAWLITRDECPIDAAHEAQFPHVVFQLPHWTIYAND